MGSTHEAVVGAVSATYDGKLPVAAAAGGVRLECRGLSWEAASSRVDELLKGGKPMSDFCAAIHVDREGYLSTPWFGIVKEPLERAAAVCR